MYYKCSTIHYEDCSKELYMASTILQVRIDDKLRARTNEIFHNLGLDMSSAVRLFLNRVVIEQGIPFPMTINTDKNTDNSGFNLLEYLDEKEAEAPAFDPVDFMNKYIKEKEER